MAAAVYDRDLIGMHSTNLELTMGVVCSFFFASRRWLGCSASSAPRGFQFDYVTQRVLRDRGGARFLIVFCKGT